MAKTKTVQMPVGIRNKLMASIAMLLVSSIMMVSTTYAWFTLSTAPEVTGITTSVGANGNLEMALLTTDTFADLDKITSAVGDSSVAKGVLVANTSWGNLVDLAEAAYGLQNINLQPARLNFATIESGEGDNKTVTYDTTKVKNVDNLLLTPTYGKDGRVNTVDGTTYAAIYNNGWAFDEGELTYGVRAIGSNDNLSAQEAGLIAAKAAYTSYMNSAKSTVQAALSKNGADLADALMTLAMGTGAELSAEQKTAIQALVTASDAALNNIDAAYKQVLLACAASIISDATLYTSISTKISEATSYSAAKTAVESAVTEYNGELTESVSKIEFTVPEFLSKAVTNLNEQKTNVSDANSKLSSAESTDKDVKDALALLVNTDEVSVNGFNVSDEDTDESNDLIVNGKPNSGFMSAVTKAGGIVVEMPAGSGVFAYIGGVAGNYSASCTVDINYSGIELSGYPATMKTTADVDTTVSGNLKGLKAAASSGGVTYLSDTYGYAIDFAFRTNAAGSYLQLQTAATQRVYEDSTSTATMGGGSTMTFKATTNDAGTATIPDEQVQQLMSAIRVAFIDPTSTTRTIYGIAALENIKADGDGFIGELYLQDSSIDNTTGKLTVTKKTVVTGEEDTTARLMQLDQNTAKRLTVVVWLDGDIVDNSMVANAAQSLTGSMNLQFSSSATLVPMKNQALNNLVITYTKETGDDYKAGLYWYESTLCTIKSGYDIYKGSDGMTYFSNDETNYTKLTQMSAATALTPVEVSVTGDTTVVEGGTTTLTPWTNAGTIKSAIYESSDTNTASVAKSESDNTATVAGVKKGTTTISANITITYGEGESAQDKVSKVDFPITVTAKASSEPVVDSGSGQS